MYVYTHSVLCVTDTTDILDIVECVYEGEALCEGGDVKF